MSNGKQGFLVIAALLGGFILSFVGSGMLWVGAPWPYQLLMLFPFMLLAFAIKRFGGTALPMLIGAIPIGTILVQGRDKDNSHLMPVLVVSAWVLGILLGHYLGGRFTRKTNGDA